MFIMGSYSLYSPTQAVQIPRFHSLAYASNLATVVPAMGSSYSGSEVLDTAEHSRFGIVDILNMELSPTLTQVKSSASVVNSKDLKFGMDRILADDSLPIKDNSVKVDRCNSTCFPQNCNCNQYTAYPAIPYATYPVQQQALLHYTTGMYSSFADQDHLNRSQNGSLGSKRKRSWSRAVFSNLQRKGLEKRFQIQKYITKPDRRQLAAMLGLTDAQVKVWFQNRRMKWRHSKEGRSVTKEEPNEETTKKINEISKLEKISLNEDNNSLDSKSEEESEDKEIQVV